MSTGQKKVDIYLKKFLPQDQITENFLDYLLIQILENFAKVWRDNGIFEPNIENTSLFSSSAINTFDIITPLLGTDGELGHLLNLDASEASQINFENTNLVNYFVGLRFAEIPNETEVNVKTGEIKYTFFEERIGELAEPDVVVDDGDETLTLTVDSIFEPGVSNAGRKVMLWLKNAVSQADTFEEAIVIWDGSNNKIETTTALGQILGNISTDTSDYQVFAIGPTVRRNTDLTLDSDILFLGKVQGKGVGNSPDTFDQSDANNFSFGISGITTFFGAEHSLVDGIHTDINPDTINTKPTVSGIQLNTKVNVADEDTPDAPLSHTVFPSVGGTGIQNAKWVLRDSSNQIIAFVDAHGNAYLQNIEAVDAIFQNDITVKNNVDVDGLLKVNNVTESTSKDTGSIVTEGGVGIEKNLNVGGNTTIEGNLTVNGTKTEVNTETLDVEDSNITVNKNGNQASANLNGAGMKVEMSDATDAQIKYDSTATSKFKLGEVGSEKEIATISDVQTLTNKIRSGGQIQNPLRSDVKKDTFANLVVYAVTATNGQLVFATDEKKLYQVIDGLLEAAGGGTGVGDADTLYLIRVDDISLSDITVTGKNATPDGGGTLTPSSLTISDVAAELLRGDTVIKYLPGVNGQGDYWGWERAIPLGDRQSNIGFQLMLKNTATTLDNDFVFWVKQMNGTMLGHVNEINLPAQYSDGTGKTIRTDSFVAHDCTLIRFGTQNKSATTTVGINIDNILVTANPFVRTQMLDEQTYLIKQAGNALTNRISEVEFNLATATIVNDGETLLVAEDDSGNTRTKFVAQRKLTVSIDASFRLGNAGNICEIHKNGVSYVHGSMDINVAYGVVASASMTLEKGEYFSVGVTGAAGVYNSADLCFMSFRTQAEKEGIVHVTGDLGDKLTETKLLTSNFGTNNAVITDLTFTNLKIGRWYRISGNTAFGGEYLNDNRLQVTYKNGTTIVGKTFYYNYQAGGTSGYEGYNVHALFKATDTTLTFNTESQISNCFLVGTNSKEYTYITLEEDSILNPMTIITPVTQTAYLKDVKASGVHGGSALVNNVQTRDLNTIEGDTSFVKLLNDQFKIGAGKYKTKFACPAYRTGYHQAFLYNVTDAIYEIDGTSEYNSSTNESTNDSIIEGLIEIDSAKTYEIRHWTGAGPSGVLGLNANGTNNPQSGEVYTSGYITMLKSN